MEAPILWLIKAQPYVRYRTQVDLLGKSESNPVVRRTRSEMVEQILEKELLKELADWPGPPLKRHNDAKHPLHKLVFLADLGIKATDPGVEPLTRRILARQSPEGPFELTFNLRPAWGGTGNDQPAWMLCDAPLILYALSRFGLADDKRVKQATTHLLGHVRDNGFPCAAGSGLQGKFRGPGRRLDPCPYANLAMLRALAATPQGLTSEAAHAGAETLLNHWQHRRERKIYLFGMGRDFAKLKAPLIWYDLLHILEVLTRFDWLHSDPRLQEMVELLAAKADEQGRFTAESVYLAWRGWDFGQKREPSPWITLLAHRILRRVDR